MPTPLTRTPLHHLRRVLEVYAQRVLADEYQGEDADDPSVVRRLAVLLRGTDQYLTGKSKRREDYLPIAEQVLGGEIHYWHLSDGGYSRITLALAPDCGSPCKSLVLDRGLSRPPVVARWDYAKGGVDEPEPEPESAAKPTEHRIFCEWPDASAYISSLSPDFQAELQALVAAHGPPAVVEFRPDGEGWQRDGDETPGKGA